MYKGRVGLTALNSTLGMAFMAEIARLSGGSESNLEPAFKALKDLLPNVGAISANLGAHATLFQQEQIDIAPYNFNFVETLEGQGRRHRVRRPGQRARRMAHQPAYRQGCGQAGTRLSVDRGCDHAGSADRGEQAAVRHHPDQYQGRVHADHEPPRSPKRPPTCRSSSSSTGKSSMKFVERRSIASIAKSRSERRHGRPQLQCPARPSTGAAASEWKLALPLAAFMMAFFVAPLFVLIAMSLHARRRSRRLVAAAIHQVSR